MRALTRKRMVSLLAAAIVSALMAGGATALQTVPSGFSLPQSQQFTNTGRQLISISPDGSQFVYVANNSLNIKAVGARESRTIAGSETPQGVDNPVFSPDGQSIAFWSGADQTLKRIPVAGGTAVTICKAGNPFGMSWGPNNVIVLGQGPDGIMRVSADGGTPQTIVTVKSGELAHGPQLLPDGTTVLFTLATIPPVVNSAADVWDKAKIVAHSMKSAENKILVEGGSDARYAQTGHVVYANAGDLMAVPFDAGRLEVTGKPVTVLKGVRSAGATGTAQYSFSSNGSLIYISSAVVQIPLAFVDLKGNVKPVARTLPPSTFAPRISPDGKRVVFDADGNIWIADLANTASPRRLTNKFDNNFPIWSADGERIVYISDPTGVQALYWQKADGSDAPELLASPARAPESWSVSNQMFSFITLKGNAGDTGDYDVWTYSLKDKKASPLITTPTTAQTGSRFSPDGHWMAYESIETGRAEIYVQPFPSTGKKFQITKNGGARPLWAPDGAKLYFDNNAGRLFSSDIRTQPSFTSTDPVPLPITGFVQGSGTTRRRYDLTADGSQFLMMMNPPSKIEFVSNWLDELKRR